MHLLHRITEGLRAFTLPAPRRPLSLEEALPRLVPKVRPRFHYEARALGAGADCPLFRPLAGSFALSLMVDFPDCEVDVTARELEAWGADFDALLQKGRSNLLLRGGEERFREVRPGLFRSTWQDGLDGSRVLLPALLKALPLRGEPVAVMPGRDILLVAGSEDPRGLAWGLEGALECVGTAPPSMNGCPLRLRGFQWEPWEPPPGHPAAPLLARVRRRRLLEEYARQKTLLDRLHGRTGLSVAPFHLGPGPNGAVTSSTFLPRGAEEGWLPEADRVGLMGGAGRHRTCHWVPWDVARARLGNLLEPLGLFPERYRVRAVPGAALLTALLETGS